MVVELVEQDSAEGVSLEDAGGTMTIVAIAGIGILLVIGAAIYVMRGSDDEEGES